MAEDTPIVQYAYDYWIDSIQRSIIYMDILRKRGNNYLEHLKAHLPPVLTFEYHLRISCRSRRQDL